MPPSVPAPPHKHLKWIFPPWQIKKKKEAHRRQEIHISTDPRKKNLIGQNLILIHLKTEISLKLFVGYRFFILSQPSVGQLQAFHHLDEEFYWWNKTVFGHGFSTP